MAEYVSFLEADESAYDLFARIVVDPVRTGIPFLDQAVFLRPGHVVELVGLSGCAKSELLIQVRKRGYWGKRKSEACFSSLYTAVQAAASCVLPTEVNGVLYGGRQGKLSALRMTARHSKTFIDLHCNILQNIACSLIWTASLTPYAWFR